MALPLVRMPLPRSLFVKGSCASAPCPREGRQFGGLRFFWVRIAFRNTNGSGLAERGYVEGRNVVFEYRFAERSERLPFGIGPCSSSLMRTRSEGGAHCDLSAELEQGRSVKYPNHSIVTAPQRQHAAADQRPDM